jgi:hypothetical protein
VLKAEAKEEEKLEVIEFPAILPSGNPLWPEFWSQKELDALKKSFLTENGRPSTSRTPHPRLLPMLT